jgi:hypothetical protein
MPGDLAPYSAAVTKLIDVVAKGIGIAYEPTRIIREARAHARAELILAATDLKIEEIKQRAAARVVHTEIARQENIENIVEIARNWTLWQVSEAINAGYPLAMSAYASKNDCLAAAADSVSH